MVNKCPMPTCKGTLERVWDDKDTLREFCHFCSYERRVKDQRVQIVNIVFKDRRNGEII